MGTQGEMKIKAIPEDPMKVRVKTKLLFYFFKVPTFGKLGCKRSQMSNKYVISLLPGVSTDANHID